MLIFLPEGLNPSNVLIAPYIETNSFIPGPPIISENEKKSTISVREQDRNSVETILKADKSIIVKTKRVVLPGERFVLEIQFPNDYYLPRN